MNNITFSTKTFPVKEGELCLFIGDKTVSPSELTNHPPEKGIARILENKTNDHYHPKIKWRAAGSDDLRISQLTIDVERLLKNFTPDWLTIAIGSIDASTPDENQKIMPASIFMKHFTKLLSKCREYSKKLPLIIIEPASWINNPAINRNLHDYTTCVNLIASEFEASVVPWHQKTLKTARSSLVDLSVEGLFPSQSGSLELADLWIETVTLLETPIK